MTEYRIPLEKGSSEFRTLSREGNAIVGGHRTIAVPPPGAANVSYVDQRKYLMRAVEAAHEGLRARRADYNLHKAALAFYDAEIAQFEAERVAKQEAQRKAIERRDRLAERLAGVYGKNVPVAVGAGGGAGGMYQAPRPSAMSYELPYPFNRGSSAAAGANLISLNDPATWRKVAQAAIDEVESWGES